jgi:DNA adenine methylase
MDIKQAKPFLKWAGGKTQLLKSIHLKLPYKVEDEFTYIEPFVGSGAVLFFVLNNYPHVKKAVINDVNADLMNTYHTIKTNVSALIQTLKTWEEQYHQLTDNTDLKKQYYYEKRTVFNQRNSDKLTQAALFIFLNRTCFNGLYRVNKKNEFNVPIGSYKTPKICDDTNLRLVSASLQKVHLLNQDFEATAEYADKNTFFYFDPPYKPLSKTASFNAYAQNSFDDNEQKRLHQFCAQLEQANHRFLLSNSDVKGAEVEDEEFFDKLYQCYQIERVAARRRINSDASKRGEIMELLISN